MSKMADLHTPPPRHTDTVGRLKPTATDARNVVGPTALLRTWVKLGSVEVVCPVALLLIKRYNAALKW
eukprot:scaffold63260_cov63-Phaeocystis_antarctica.AAC.1